MSRLAADLLYCPYTGGPATPASRKKRRMAIQKVLLGAAGKPLRFIELPGVWRTRKPPAAPGLPAASWQSWPPGTRLLWGYTPIQRSLILAKPHSRTGVTCADARI